MSIDRRAVGAWTWGEPVPPSSFDDYETHLDALAQAIDELRRLDLLVPDTLTVLGWTNAAAEDIELWDENVVHLAADAQVAEHLAAMSRARGGRRPVGLAITGACTVTGDPAPRPQGCQLFLDDGRLRLELLPEEFAAGPLRARNAPRLRAALDAIAKITGQPTVPDYDARGESTPTGVTLAA